MFYECPLGILENVTIILRRPFLASVRCKIDDEEKRLTFDVGEHHAEFGLFKEYEFSSSAFPYCRCDVLASEKAVDLVDVFPNDSYMLDYISFDLIVRRWIWLKAYNLALSRTSIRF